MRKKQAKGWTKHSDFMVLDLVIMQLCFLAAYRLTHDGVNPYQIIRFRSQALTIAACQVVITFLMEPYKNILRRGFYLEMLAVIKYAVEVLAITLFCYFALQQTADLSRTLTVTLFVLFIFVSYGIRLLNKKRIEASGILQSIKNQRSLVLVTNSTMAESILPKLTEDVAGNFRVNAIIFMDQATPDISEMDGIQVLGRASDVLERIGQGWVDEVFISNFDQLSLPENFIESLMDMGLSVHLSISTINPEQWSNIGLEKLGGYKVITSSYRTITGAEALQKRLLDIAGGIVGCLLTVILAVFIGPAIYLKSPGPIFFAQERIGQNGRRFKLYKFRSMYLDAEKKKADLIAQNKGADPLMFKMEDDPRIIGSEKKDKNGKPAGIGNFIRNTSLDEFPQFWNVLKGEMSLVGTRPPTVDEWKQYELQHRVRMSIKPGITGLWQVSGRSEITDFNEVVKLDREYIEDWNLGMDLRILLRTVVVVLSRKGAF